MNPTINAMVPYTYIPECMARNEIQSVTIDDKYHLRTSMPVKTLMTTLENSLDRNIFFYNREHEDVARRVGKKQK